MNNKKINIINSIVILIFLVLFLLGFTYLRFFILLAFVCMAVINLIRKKAWLFVDLALVVLLFFSMAPGRYPFLYQNLEHIRFMILQNEYTKEVEKIVSHYPDDMEYQKINGCKLLLTSQGEVSYQREKESVVVFFMTDYTHVSGYVYYSDDTAKDWMNKCERIEEIAEHWLMVQAY